MKRMIGRMFSSYGSKMSIIHDGQEQTVYAFVQPVTEKSRQELRVSDGAVYMWALLRRKEAETAWKD